VAQVRHTESALCFSLPVGLNSDEQGGFSFSAGDVLQLARTRLRPLRSGRFSSTSARVKMRFGLSRRGPLSVAVQGWVGGQDLYAGCPIPVRSSRRSVQLLCTQTTAGNRQQRERMRP